ncbi:MAG: hypothetical protein AAFU53_01930 [Cyanobacteria bacterium J06632_3]
MVARTDIPFMMHTIPHLVKSCNFDFHRKVLVVDTAPLTGDKVNRPGIGTMEQLRENCDELILRGVMDETIDMDYSKSYQRRIYKKHFGTDRLGPTHNYKGYPILGSIFAIEEVPGDYVLHFDSDMLLYQKPGYSWIQEAIDLLERREDVMFVRPLSGPPTKDGSLVQRVPYQRDPEDFYRFKFFGSRAFLIQREKFEQLLPLPTIWMGYKNQWMKQLPSPLLNEVNTFLHRGALDSWEVMVSQKLENTTHVRATLANPQAWTLHPIDRGPDFMNNLTAIIRKIEEGEVPSEQAGNYDLMLDVWLPWLALSQGKETEFVTVESVTAEAIKTDVVETEVAKTEKKDAEGERLTFNR